MEFTNKLLFTLVFLRAPKNR